MASSLLIASLVAIVFGGAATAYFWLVHRHRLEAGAGMKIVAGMRWREFSQLVVDALRERGFDPAPDSTPHRGQQTDLVLRRDGRSWLLACKQGMDYRITPATLAEFAKSMRLNDASAGLIATPGSIDPEARKQAGDIELFSGAALWPMLKPLLPDSVRNTVATQAHARSARFVALGWVAALLLGVGTAWLLPTRIAPRDPDVTATAPSGPIPGNAALDNPLVLAPAPLSEAEQRELVQQEVSDLPGINRAMWSTRSTLLVYLGDDSGLDPLQAICGVVERYDGLSASRLQLQPVPGSSRPVRFLQCKLY